MSLIKDIAASVGNAVSGILGHGRNSDSANIFSLLSQEIQTCKEEMASFLAGMEGFVYTYDYRSVMNTNSLLPSPV